MISRKPSRIALLAAVAASVSFGSVASAQYSGLYITEIITVPTENEVIEIVNASGAAMDISGVIVSDEDNTNTEGAVKFPASTSLAAGEVVVIAVNTSATEPAWLDTLPAGVRVFVEPARNPAAWTAANGNTITPMDDYPIASGGTGGGISLGGTSDNVTLYKPTATFALGVGVNSTADCIDGMNYGVAPYAPIAPSTAEGTAATDHTTGNSLQRASAVANTSSASAFSAAAATGTVGVFVLGANNAPVLSNRATSPVQPTSASALSFSVDASDSDGTVTGVNLFYSVETDGVVTGPFTSAAMALSSGTTYTVAPAALASLPAGSVVFYYFQATDDDTATGNLGTAVAPFTTYVNDSRPAAGEVVINEFAFTGTAVDWVEFLNTTGTAKDLSYWRFSDNSAAEFAFPYGTTIPANGFVIVTENVGTFTTAYPSVTATVLGPHSIGLSASGDSVELLPDGGSLTPYDSIAYTAVAPWTGVTAGRTAELIDPSSDNSLGASWSTSAYKNTAGSPGAVNFAKASAPVVTSTAAITVKQGGTFPATAVATIGDNQTSPELLTLGTSGAASGITATASNTTGTPTAPANGTASLAGSVGCAVTPGAYSVTLEATDAASSVGSAAITINVTANAAPTLGNYGTVNLTAGNGDTNTPAAAPADADDATGLIVSVSPTDFGGTGSASVDAAGVVTLSTTGLTPATTYNFTVTVADPCGASVNKGFSVNVGTSVSDWWAIE